MRDDYIDDGDDGRVEDTEWELDEAGTLEALSFSSVHPVQGNYVMSFHMTEREEGALAQHAQTQLTSLLSECEYNSPGWRRVRGKKGSRVKLWEKGSASALTKTSTEHKRLRRIASPLDRPTWLASSAASSSSAPSMHAIYSVKSSITVKAPLESVLKTLDCSYATSYRSFTKLMYQNLVADTSVLFHNHQTPEMTESLAVRWLVTRCQNPLVSDCDFCLVDYTKVHSIDELSAVVGGYQGNNHNEGNNDASARAHDGLRDCEALPVAYKILRSIDTKYCPELSSSHHLVRGAVPLGGFLLYPTENSEVTDVVFYMSVVYERKKPASPSQRSFLSSDDRQFRAMQTVLQQMALGIGRIRNAVDAYAMSLQLEALRATRWVDNTMRAECVVCYRRFHPIARRRHHCRLCGDVICRDCSVHKDADLPTVGPTTLRICKLCNAERFGRLSGLATIAVDHKQAALLEREAALEATTLHSPTMRQMRRSTLSSDNTDRQSFFGAGKSRDELQSSLEHRSPSFTDRSRRHSSVDQPLSCPKASVLSMSQKWNESTSTRPTSIITASPSPSPAGRWSKAFFASRANSGSRILPPHTPGSPSTFTSTSSLHSNQAPVAPIQANSCSKVSQQAQDRFNFGIMKKIPLSPGQQRMKERTMELHSPIRPWKGGPMGFSSTLPRKSALISPHRLRQVQPRERHSHKLISLKKLPKRALSLERCFKFSHVEQYEDLLHEMCDRASVVTYARYAAVSVFTGEGASLSPPTKTVAPAPPTMTHYLKVMGGKKLMKVASNMKCCEPVLHLLRPVVTRNTLTCRIEGYAFADLPLVKGPQQVRFYAGIPLVDSKERLLGALVVCDSKFVEEEEELMECTELLESVARAIVNRIEERHEKNILKSFMDTPLVRQSEPVASSSHPHNVPVEGEEGDEETVRTAPFSLPDTSRMALHSPKAHSVEYYKRQMLRLVEQANETQDQVMQTITHIQEVSY